MQIVLEIQNQNCFGFTASNIMIMSKKLILNKYLTILKLFSYDNYLNIIIYRIMCKRKHDSKGIISNYAKNISQFPDKLADAVFQLCRTVSNIFRSDESQYFEMIEHLILGEFRSWPLVRIMIDGDDAHEAIDGYAFINQLLSKGLCTRFRKQEVDEQMPPDEVGIAYMLAEMNV
jgi:hypothetical protein